MKILQMILLGIMLLLQGCLSNSTQYYVLSMAKAPKELYAHEERIIGVEKVTLPSYLYKRELAIGIAPNQIALLSDALWAEDLDNGLSQRLIGFLQKKFKQPSIYAYPWGMLRQVDVKVSLNVSRFIIEEGFVYLDASWSLESLKTGRRMARLFDIKVASTIDSPSVVSAMDKAFSALEEDIARGIKVF
jgi:cholesterol transport system auxiliary component